MFYNLKLLQQFFISFIIILIPFLIVNGILTGAITEVPIVWYNNLENLGIRVVTIPIEDFAYAYSMLFGNILIFEKLKKQAESIKSKNNMYPYHNRIKQRINNKELVDYEYVEKYKNISPCLVLHFNTEPKIRPIRIHRFKEYKDILDNVFKPTDQLNKEI